ncbi:MAG TPA: acyl-CoA thioesterase II [Microbacteriaceae bacterium]|nr:acyl-CoA thioesterase II [Microbacteriaceae bacterium]
MLDVLTLTDAGARTHEDIFTGRSVWMPAGRVFGGQVLAQSMIAACHTVPPERVVHSLHGYFLRPGDTALPISFAVDRIHDGRSFSARRVQAYQRGVPILSMITSFQTQDEGFDHQLDMPAGLPRPEELSGDDASLARLTDPVTRHWAQGRAFEMRHVSSPVYLKVRGERVAHQCVWFKTRSPLPDDENLHRAALVYASDYSILESVFRRHGVSWSDRDAKIASLDHAMWWHRFGRVDRWLLYAQESPSATGGRGFATGRIYTRDGILLASVAQEGMIRVGGR